MSKLRYQLTQNGISPRWIPGSNDEFGNPHPIYFANGDEHNELGSVDESSSNAILMTDKRKLKQIEIEKYLPEPEIFGPNVANLSFIGFGSSKNVMIDLINFVEKFKTQLRTANMTNSKNTNLNTSSKTKSDLLYQKLEFTNNIWSKLENLIMQNTDFSINYFHYSYIWPLKTPKFLQFQAQNPNICLIEGNSTAQLGNLIRMQTGIEFKNQLLKYDGRQFFMEDLLDFIRNYKF